MQWAFVALMCLEPVAAAGDSDCFSCGCKTEQIIYQEEKPELKNADGVELLAIQGDAPLKWIMYDGCVPSLHEVKTQSDKEKYGVCGVGESDDGTSHNFCAGCQNIDNMVRGIYPNKCPEKTDACKCKWEGKTLPKEAWVAPTADPTTGNPIGAGNPLFGTYCRDWNMLPGVADGADDIACPKSKMCTPKCNWKQNVWCFVEEGCVTHINTLTSVETLRPHHAAFSYEVCGSANCFANQENGVFKTGHACPEGPGCEHYNHCECLFEGTTLPASVSDYEGNPLYGTHCEIAWDLLPGTKSYTDQPECMEGESEGVDPDKCSKECNWHYNHWCYVEMGCPGLAAADITLSSHSADLVMAAKIKYPGRQFIEGIGYSYAMCGSANCQDDAFDTNPDCPFGEDCLTCGMVKHDYKMQECCHHPESAIHIHHVFHEGMEFSLHEGDQTWKLPSSKDTHYDPFFMVQR